MGISDLYRLTGDLLREQEAIQTHSNFSQLLLKDHFQASQLPEHNLIQVSLFYMYCILSTLQFCNLR